MAHDAADTAQKTGQIDRQCATAADAGGQSATLAGRYRQIGIPAVVAAARYQGGAKNPAYAPSQAQWRDIGEEAAS